MKGIEFKGKLVSLFMPADLEAAGLSEAGVFFPLMYSFSPGDIPLAGGKTIKLDTSTAVLAMYETHKATITLNAKEEALTLHCDSRLVDTRYGLMLYLKWTLSPGTLQQISIEQPLAMHAEGIRHILQRMFASEVFIFAYCDLNERTVVRTSLMFSEHFQVIRLMFEKATQLIASGETYAQECDMPRAQQEATEYIDAHPIDKDDPSVSIPVPERTYE